MNTGSNNLGNMIPGAWMLEALQRGGVDLDRLTDALPREMGILTRAPDTQKPDDMSRLFAECVAQSGDFHFGLHMVEFAPVESMGIYGYLLLNAPTIGETLDVAEKYFPTFFLGAKLQFSARGKTCKLRFLRAGPEIVSPRHGNEWALGFFVHLIRSRVGPHWYPDRVSFSHKKPADMSELSRVFGQELQFQQAENSIEFEHSLLEKTVTDADPKLLRIIMAYADELLATAISGQSLESQVRLLILENINQDGGGAKEVARALHMSLSTLKRRLSGHKLSYRSLREGVSMDIARRALAETDIRVTDVALKSGYSDLCSFDRAFARASGITPLAYRKSTGQQIAQ
jgi:AraC-like DNA-binding protein